jgi:1,4-alpha-glucan branching enzyme
LAQWREWAHEESLEWGLLQYAPHQGVQLWVQDLNRLYRSEAALYELDCQPEGFEWIDCCDASAGVISFIRKAGSGDAVMLIVCNFTSVVRAHYRVGAPRGGFWREILNSDAKEYGGGARGNMGGVEASPIPLHGRLHSLDLTLPPLGILFLQPGVR